MSVKWARNLCFTLEFGEKLVSLWKSEKGFPLALCGIMELRFSLFSKAKFDSKSKWRREIVTLKSPSTQDCFEVVAAAEKFHVPIYFPRFLLEPFLLHVFSGTFDPF